MVAGWEGGCGKEWGQGQDTGVGGGGEQQHANRKLVEPMRPNPAGTAGGWEAQNRQPLIVNLSLALGGPRGAVDGPVVVVGLEERLLQRVHRGVIAGLQLLDPLSVLLPQVRQPLLGPGHFGLAQIELLLQLVDVQLQILPLIG